MTGTFLLLLVVLAVASAAHEYMRFESPGASNTTCVCTTVPCPVKGANSLTVGGGAVGTYNYVLHNNIAVVSSASITITSAQLDKGSDTTSCTQSYSRTLDDDGVQDCDAGHILAHRLGGPGNQPINIIPQDSHVNRGEYSQFEDKIYQCIAAKGGTSAKLSWSYKYQDSTKTKPISITYSVAVTGGSCGSFSQTFSN